MNKIGNKIEIALFVVLVVLALGVAFWWKPAADPGDSIAEPSATETSTPEAAPDINTVGMVENKSIYDEDDPLSVVYFYVTVQRGDEGSDTDHSFAEVNSAVRFVEDSHVANDIFARAIVQVGDASGPQPGMLGYDATASNATIRVRGNSSSVRPQKSYKLDLDDEAGLWRGQSNIALNKHNFDATRLRNKLYFDLLRPVEDISSLRTQFVRLYIKDETAGETTFTDYGLFTQAEVPSKKYLANHGLDSEGYLYKAISFNFEMSDALKNFDDPAFDQAAFDQVLSCKGRQDNQKLIDLVNLIADRSVDINEIVGDYIDRDNYLTWLAYNILMGNNDTTVQNFYLYSPLNSQKWFFIPWDGDNCLHWQEDAVEGLTGNYGSWEHGVANYWGVLLHQRFLKNEANRAELAPPELYQRAVKQMATLNKYACEIAQKYRVHSMTDVTGFALMGHATEMARGSDLTIVIDSAKVPVLPGVQPLAEMGLIPEGAYRNRQFAGPTARFAESVPLYLQDILYDPQTSGGLLIAVDARDAEKLLAELLQCENVPGAAIIGCVEQYQDCSIYVK